MFAFIKCLPLSREFTSTVLYSRIPFVKDHSLSLVTAVCAQNLIFLPGNFLENGRNHGVLWQLASSPRSSTEAAPCSPASSREGPRLQPAPEPFINSIFRIDPSANYWLRWNHSLRAPSVPTVGCGPRAVVFLSRQLMNRFNGVCPFLQAPPFTTLDRTGFYEMARQY